MKILHVIPSVGPKRGGPSFAVSAMAQAVTAQGVEVHIATTNDNGDEHLSVPCDRPVIKQDVTYHYFQRQTKFYTFSSSLTCWLAQNLAQFELVHIHSLFSYSTLAAAWLAHFHRIPYIVRPLGHLNRWGIQNRRAIIKRISLLIIEQPLLSRARLLHFTSEQERLEAKEVGVEYPSVVLPLGVDVEPFRALPSKNIFLSKHPQLQDKICLLFLSRIDPKKGVELLFTTFAQLQRQYRNLALVIAGDGEPAYLTQLRSLAQQLDITANIVWVGFLSGNEKLAALAAASIFVLPSYSENFGIAVVEAMAAGLPVVITDQVGIHHEVTQHQAGLVTGCQTNALILALQHLVSDPELRQRCGEQGRHLVADLFSKEAMAKRLLAMYKQVLPVNSSSQPITTQPKTKSVR